MSEMIKIPDGWESLELGNILKIETGSKNAEDSTVDGIYPFFTRAEETQKINTYSYDTEALFIAGEGNFRVKYYNGKFEAHQRTYVLTSKDNNIVLSYLQKAIQPKITRLISTSVGSTVMSLRKPQIAEIDVLSPKSKQEQQKIAEVLSEVDNAISKTEELFEKNKRLKTALMQDLLSYGVDEKGKVRNPQTHKFKPSELGDISEEWDLKSLGEISFLTSSKRVYFQEYTKSGIPFYRGKEITELKNNSPIEDLLYISREKYNHLKINFGVPCKNDILITAVGTLGNVFRVHDEREFYFKDGNLIWLKDIKIKSEFLEVSLNYNHNSILDSAAGSSQKALTIVNLKKIKIPVPKSKTEQQKIAQILSSQDEKIEEIKNKLNKLKSLKASLMQDLLSGKVRVTKLMEENS